MPQLLALRLVVTFASIMRIRADFRFQIDNLGMLNKSFNFKDLKF